WWGQASNITPPVALAAYVAANVADAPLWKSGNAAVIKGAGLFFLPVLFIYQPGLLLQGSLVDIVVTICSIIVGVTLIAAAIEGFLLRALPPLFRIAYATTGILLIIAHALLPVIALCAVAFALIWIDVRMARKMSKAQSRLISS
ncbi:MAG: hypothetical protein ACMG6H_11990, partial [Acidobacteriota bacterium]